MSDWMTAARAAGAAAASSRAAAAMTRPCVSGFMEQLRTAQQKDRDARAGAARFPVVGLSAAGRRLREGKDQRTERLVAWACTHARVCRAEKREEAANNADTADLVRMNPCDPRLHFFGLSRPRPAAEDTGMSTCPCHERRGGLELSAAVAAGGGRGGEGWGEGGGV